MSAHPTPEELAELAEGLLASKDARRLDTHLAGCAACQEVRAGLDALRAVLAADQPGPMPASVAARLDAALADARAEVGAAIPAAHAPAPTDGSRPIDVSPLRRRRHTAGDRSATFGQRMARRYARVASLAAGLVLIVGASVLGIQVVRETGAPPSGTSGASSGSAERATGLAQEPGQSPGQQPGQGRSYAPGGDASAQLSSGPAYTAGGFARQVAALVRTADGRAVTPAVPKRKDATGGSAAADGQAGAGADAGADARADARASAQASAMACAADLATRVGQRGVDPIAVDVGTWEGAPALVVVLPRPGAASSVHAYVVPRDCSGGPTVLHDEVVPRP